MKDDNTPIEDLGTPQTSETSIVSEDARSAVVLSFGRLNPPTSGHQKLVDKIVSVARRKKATPMLFMSQSQDKKKNPLSYADKVKYATKAFGKIVQKSKARTIIEVLKELTGKYDEVTIVVGGDRIEEFKKLISKYNGKDYNFKNIDYMSAGERDPDADDVTGMSASKLRGHAVAGEYKQYRAGLPRRFSDRDAKEMYNKIRSAMGISEEMTLQEVLTFQQRMKKKMMMRRIKGRIKRGRLIAKRRLASPEKLKTRSAKKARQIMRSRLAGAQGKKYNQLPYSARMQIDKKLKNKQAIISRLAKRLLPKVRAADRARLAKLRSGGTKKESFDVEYIRSVDEVLRRIEREQISEAVEKNLRKKSEKYGVSISQLKEKYIGFKMGYIDTDAQTAEQQAFNSLNVMLANEQKTRMQEAYDYHIQEGISFVENVYRVGSMNYFKLIEEAKKRFEAGEYNPDPFEAEFLQTDIGEFAMYEGEHVPLDCPMEEPIAEEEKKPLGKPMRGGPKKFYVYVKDPSTGNIKKVTFGDTTGLKVKLDDPKARKSFAARHQCSTQNDRTKAAYWACRLPRYAKQLGLSGGGNFFW